MSGRWPEKDRDGDTNTDKERQNLCVWGEEFNLFLRACVLGGHVYVENPIVIRNTTRLE